MRILQLEVVLEQRLVVQRLEAQLVAGVRRVGDQLAQEDLAVRVQRMDHELQELPDLGLEAQGLAVGVRAAVFSVTEYSFEGDLYILAPVGGISSPARAPAVHAVRRRAHLAADTSG